MLEINIDDKEIAAELKNKNGEVVATIYKPCLEDHLKVEKLMSGLEKCSPEEQESKIKESCSILNIPTANLSAKSIISIILACLDIKKN